MKCPKDQLSGGQKALLSSKNLFLAVLHRQSATTRLCLCGCLSTSDEFDLLWFLPFCGVERVETGAERQSVG